jgi:6-phosphogluconolactonase
MWLVSGGDKRGMLARLRAGDHSIPAGRIEQARAIVLADRAAAQPGSTALPQPAARWIVGAGA